MITDDYVSFKMSKLLKEKGFDSNRCQKMYNSKHKLLNNIFFGAAFIKNEELLPEQCIAPTIQVAAKWLRKKYNLHVDIGYDGIDWFWNILSVDKNVPVEERPKIIKDGLAGNKSYEEALKNGIKYCLENLI